MFGDYYFLFWLYLRCTGAFRTYRKNLCLILLFYYLKIVYPISLFENNLKNINQVFINCDIEIERLISRTFTLGVELLK